MYNILLLHMHAIAAQAGPTLIKSLRLQAELSMSIYNKALMFEDLEAHQ